MTFQPFPQSLPSGNPISHPMVRDSEHLQQQLIHATIHPDVASDYINRIEFDGTGRIKKIKNMLDDTTLQRLQEAIIPSLAQTISPLSREDNPRTERDGILWLLGVLHSDKSTALEPLYQQARLLWMQGDFCPEKIAGLYAVAKENRVTASKVDRLILILERDLQRVKSPAQYHENLSGRFFDSAFADELTQYPPELVIDTAQKTGNALFQDFNKLEDPNMPLRALAMFITDDYRPWFKRCPEIDDFLKNTNQTTAEIMLKKVTHGYDAIKIPYLAVRTGWALQQCGYTPKWLQDASLNYKHVVGPERNALQISSSRQTQRSGILLPHQPSCKLPDLTAPYAKSWADEKTIDFDDASAFDIHALYRGHPVVNGASGSANILAFFHRNLAQTDPDFSVKGGMLNAMMFLIHDGGHSVNEVAAVYETVLTTPALQDPKSVHEIWARSRARLSSYNLDYQHLASSIPAASSDVQSALDRALDRTLDISQAWYPKL